MPEVAPALTRKPLVFVASARKDLQQMPEDVQDSFGFKLDRAQIGRHPIGAPVLGGCLGRRGRAGQVSTEEESAMNNKRRASTARPAALGKMPEDVVFEEGRGNVFADLGRADAEECQAKANLAHVIVNIVEDHGWTQKKAASVLGIAESEMSDIVNGKLRRFSRERLERYLNVLGMEIRIQVYPRPAGKQRAGVSVQVLATG